MWAGLGPWLLALALGPAGLWAQMRLEEAGGALRAPGESVLLSCRGSGFTFENHPIWWYRQAPRGRPDWVSIDSPDFSHDEYGPAIEGRALMFRDKSRFEVYLSLRELQPWDSARYSCAALTATGNPAEL